MMQHGEGQTVSGIAPARAEMKAVEPAAAIGRVEAMEAALHQVGEADPARAERRSGIIREAWSGLPGWRS